MLEDKIYATYEINNTFYTIGFWGVSTLKNELCSYPAGDYDEHNTSCLIGNNILVIRRYTEELNVLEYKLLDTKTKQVSNLIFEMSRTYFAAVEFNNQLWFVGGLMQIDDLITEDIDPFAWQN